MSDETMPEPTAAVRQPQEMGPAQGMQEAQGTWWYQYPDGTWVWWSKQEGRWVRLDVPRTAKTPRWVWVLVAIAALVMVAGTIAAFSQLPAYLEEEIERIERIEQRERSETDVRV